MRGVKEQDAAIPRNGSIDDASRKTYEQIGRPLAATQCSHAGMERQRNPGQERQRIVVSILLEHCVEDSQNRIPFLGSLLGIDADGAIVRSIDVYAEPGIEVGRQIKLSCRSG